MDLDFLFHRSFDSHTIMLACLYASNKFSGFLSTIFRGIVDLFSTLKVSFFEL